MKIVIAPDSFKGSLTSAQAIDVITRAAEEAFPGANVVGLPIADGGEGSAEALVRATGGKMHTYRVRGPLGAPVEARWGEIPGWDDNGAPLPIAIVEAAQASGLALLEPDALDPLEASSYGTGEVLAHVMARGYTHVVMALGGSATNDGGAGMLQALGAIFSDERGQELPGCGGALGDMAKIDLSDLRPEIQDTHISVLCDVRAPLLGPRGATAVFGPQKGVTPDLMPFLEHGMESYARTLSRAIEFNRTGEFRPFGGYALHEAAALAGSGAAGGMGFALVAALGAKLLPGVENILDMLDFSRVIAGASLVVTGEGRLDEQSFQGKAVEGMARRCADADVPLLVLAGSLGAFDTRAMQRLLPGAGVMAAARAAEPIETLMANAEEYLYDAASRAFALMKLGRAVL